MSKLAAQAKIPSVQTSAETEDESSETKADNIQEIYSNPTTAASIIREVTLTPAKPNLTLHPGVTETVKGMTKLLTND